jgi:hypothetical protein
MMPLDNEDDKPFDSSPGFGYNQEHLVCDLRKSLTDFVGAKRRISPSAVACTKTNLT